MALFFIGAPVLIATLDSSLKVSRPWFRRSTLALLLGLLLLDNSAWLAKTAVHNDYLVSLTNSQSAILHWLRWNLKSGDMVICRDGLISYLVSTYTPAQSWQGHEHNTPSMEQRHNEVERVFSEGHVLPEWKRPGVVYVSPAAWLPPAELSLERRYGNGEFSIWAPPQDR
jgi:hypothetical protein